MAQRTRVLLIDDLDGSEADETVVFGLDGSSYEVDLSSKNASALRDALADYVGHGRKASAIRSNSSHRFAGSSAHHSGPETSEVRAWAKSNGYSVSERGRIAAGIMDSYLAAH